MRRVLVTGGAGQVGSALRGSAPSDIAVFAPTSSELDIADATSVAAALETIRPDFVINCAAFTAVDRAEHERNRAYAVNSDGAANLARLCADAKVPIVHVSTDYVFDGRKESPYVEEDTPSPLNAYGASKLDGEQRVSACGGQHLILRVSWVFSATGTNFVKTMLSLAAREELRVVDDQFGTPCAADDIAECIWRIERERERMQDGIFHFSSLPETTWYRFACVIFPLAHQHGLIDRIPRVVPIPAKEYRQVAVRPRNSVMDSDRLFRSFGVPRRDWRDSLDKVLRELARRAAKH